jgi:hypothetical protein
VHLVGEAHADLVEDVEDRVPPVGEVLVAASTIDCGDRREHRDGLPDARPGEADDRLTPSFAATRAVFFMSSAARWRTPSGSPSPQIRAGRIPLCRSSIGSSQIAWPTRWLEIVQTLRPYLSSSSRLASR